MAMERLTEILGKLPRVTKRRDDRLALLVAAWPRAVGERLAERSQVVGYDRGRLRVQARDGVWAEQLKPLRLQLLNRLSAILPAVPLRSLVIRAAPQALGPIQDPCPPVAAAPELPREVVERAAELEPELREALLKTAGAYLAGRRRSSS